MPDNARPYLPLSFANEFISMSAGAGVEHMKLQKLVYYAYGWWLAANETPIISEAPEVWRHGPVFPSLYNALKGNGGRPITTLQKRVYFQPAPRLNDGDFEADELANWIWQKYSVFSSFELSDKSHAQGSPWSTVAKSHDYRVPFNTEIPDEVTKSYFRGLATRSEI